jgi:tetratricopeptide (TPR) repeat protein
MSQGEGVSVRSEEIELPTYMPALPDRNPMFLEKRVYQGSSGRVYPLPFTDRIASQPISRKWKAVWIENEFLRVMILPEIGGRIHIAQDKTNDFDIIYRQNVIKPALVGLAGPWISGGIEFNWPQHHRPATFLPVDVHVEEHTDGSKTVWCGDHDPMARMKGMHGVCLHPDKAYIHLKARAHNRTNMTQTFLWWANVATRVHESYQSFFPPDVYYVADHARRSMSQYPLCQASYYGVDYAKRGKAGVPASEYPTDFQPSKAVVKYAANDLSFYANIPVPTSYMCMGSKEDFFGGYDHAKQAGIVHIANHLISPGKKQWTWGNHEFGYAWDRNLTDADGPYIEIMAGVYTDNQPDFSFLQPGETKSWSQYWYPIQKIGPAQHANLDAAVSLKLEDKSFRVGVSVSRAIVGATIELRQGDAIAQWKADLAPGQPFVVEQEQPAEKWAVGTAQLCVLDSNGHVVIAYRPVERVHGKVPGPATEPDEPKRIESADELYITGVHLEQYRHATRCPTTYWREALRRDPLDSRCNNAMGLWHMRRGELDKAEKHFRAAIKRLTTRNANPHDGEAYYNLGLCLRYKLDFGLKADFEEAYAAFYKATWNQPFAAAGYLAVAELDCRRQQWQALEHLDRALRFDTENLRTRDLKALVLKRLGRGDESQSLLRQTLEMDPLDWWAKDLLGQELTCDLQTVLDIAHDYARAGLYAEAIAALQNRIQKYQKPTDPAALPDQSWGAMPLAMYTLAWLHGRLNDDAAAQDWCQRAAQESPDYCFPARLEEIAILEFAIRTNPDDPKAPYYLGNLFYDRRRHSEAIALWEQSVKIDPKFSIPWRNLGIGYFNIEHDGRKARRAYDRALKANPADARLLYERDQLAKRLGVRPKKRLAELERRRDLVDLRDDLTIELAALFNQTGRHDSALSLLTQRQFQPWEGGEGAALGQFVRAHLALGRIALEDGDAGCATEHFRQALVVPRNLGEARHLLANQSDIHYWLGTALDAAGNRAEAERHWTAAAEFKGDFQNMSVRVFSEMTYYSALSMRSLGKKKQADKLLRQIRDFGRKLCDTADEAKIEYFATSLPTMLLFDDDLPLRQETTGLLLRAQARLGLGSKAKARQLLEKVLKRDPSHALAADLARPRRRRGR